MEIVEGNRKIKNGTIKSIVDIKCNDKYQLHVFQGYLSENDILIKYQEQGKRIRTPRHIHWAVDILIKLQGDKDLTRNFLSKLKKDWENCKPLVNNDRKTLSKFIIDGEKKINIDSFKSLNQYGEYDIDFLFTLMQLLMVQEKTNNENAHMFGDIIDSLLNDDIDIFSIMSTAGFNGR